MGSLGKLVDPSGFPPRWACGDWSLLLGWAHIASDIVTWASYTAIPIVLAVLIRRRATPVPRVAWLFVAFILCCGLTHLLEAVIFWIPLYRLAAVLKLATATVSAATVVVLIRSGPAATDSPAFADLAHELARAKQGRLRAEDRLRALGAILERTPDVALELSAQCDVVWANASAAALVGCDPDDLTGASARKLFVEEERVDGVLDANQSSPETTVLSVARSDGTRHLEASVVRLPSQGWALVGRDVTEREEAKLLLESANHDLEMRIRERTASLHETNAQLVEAHRLAGLGSWRYDAETDTISWSDTLYELFDVPIGKPLGALDAHLDEFFRPDDRQRLSVAIKRALTAAEPYALELEVEPRGRRPTFITARGRAIKTVDGPISGLEGTVVDISRLKHQERKLYEANRRLEFAVEQRTAELRSSVADLESFVHLVAHDLQQPLRNLSLRAGQLEELLGPQLNQEGAHVLERIRQATLRMRGMIGALAELSLAHRAEINIEDLDVADVVSTIAADHAELLASRGGAIACKGSLRARTDPVFVERILTNLITNGLKYGGRPPEVWVSGEEKGSELCVYVDDNGPGVDPAFTERAFLPFKRHTAHAATEGMGMGLSICQRAVERLGGRIWMEPRPHGGTRVTFTLPS